MGERWKGMLAAVGIGLAAERGMVIKDKMEEKAVEEMSVEAKENSAEDILAKIDQVKSKLKGVSKEQAISFWEQDEEFFNEILDSKGTQGTKVWKNTDKKPLILNELRGVLKEYKTFVASERGNEEAEDMHASINMMGDWLKRIEAGTDEKS